MRIISWNVNGLRSCLGKGFREFLAKSDADVICIQETKMQQEQLDVVFPGYELVMNSAERKGYSGTAILYRVAPDAITFGIDGAYNDEGRAITFDYQDFYLVNVYSPNAQEGLARLPYRMAYEDRLRQYLLRLDAVKPVILCGDLNVAHREIDLKNPKANRMNAGFSDEERAKFGELLDAGFIDVFRHLHPETVKYSWWSYLFHARENNAGWRIDYFVISNRLGIRVAGTDILTDVLGSDHCPILLDLD